MTTRFIKGCKYTHRKHMDVYIQVEAVEDFEDYFKLAIIWRKRSNDEILNKSAHIVCISRNNLHEWNPWLK